MAYNWDSTVWLTHQGERVISPSELYTATFQKRLKRFRLHDQKKLWNNKNFFIFIAKQCLHHSAKTLDDEYWVWFVHVIFFLIENVTPILLGYFTFLTNLFEIAVYRTRGYEECFQWILTYLLTPVLSPDAWYDKPLHRCTPSREYMCSLDCSTPVIAANMTVRLWIKFCSLSKNEY